MILLQEDTTAWPFMNLDEERNSVHTKEIDKGK
jgi:hypothetical protein